MRAKLDDRYFSASSRRVATSRSNGRALSPCVLDDFTPEIMLGRDGLERFLNLDLDVAEELIGHSSPMFHGRQLSPPLSPPGPRLSSPLLAAAGLHAQRRSFAQLDDEEAYLNDTIDTNLSAEEALAAAVAASERADQTLAAGAAGSVCSTRSGSSRDGSPRSAVREFSLRRAEADAASARAEAADAAGRANRLERVAMDAMLERDDALDELESTRAMLQDAMLHIDALRRRLVDGDLENMMLRANHRPPRTAAASDGVFGLTKTKEAIEKAVKEACALPEAERRKKINALRLKWHPDKHEVLGEMAEEVTKLINEAVERHGGS